MNFSEKVLYHQIHPLKLGTDILTSIFTLYLFWRHFFWIAFILHFLIPGIASFLLIRFANLEKQKDSRLGKYIRKYLTDPIDTIRLAGDIITIFGAWFHQWIIILLGFLIIIGAWTNGKIRKITPQS